jgi:hypothetical protein
MRKLADGLLLVGVAGFIVGVIVKFADPKNGLFLGQEPVAIWRFATALWIVAIALYMRPKQP